MPQRRDLNAPQGRKLAAAIRAARDAGRSSKTGAAGVVDYGETGNATWIDPATGEPASVRDLPPRIDEAQQAIDEAKVELGETQEQLDAAKQAILDEAQTRADALEVANGLLDELEQRLNDGPTAEELEDIRTELGVVLGDAATAQAAAEAAQSAADTANANALAAAGIAADKGRIIYAPEPPTSEADRSTSNLWIDSDNGRVYVWAPEPAPGAWVESENESLRDAAQAAAAALAAAEAADARAGAAAAAAAAAQQAAEAAQTTANEATLDARDAWNEAVAATDRADAIRADLGKGPSLWEDPSFERGLGIMPGPFPGRIEVSTDWAATGSQSVRYTASGTGGNVFGQYVHIPATPGRWYALSATLWAPQPQRWRTVWNGWANGATVQTPLSRTVDLNGVDPVSFTDVFQVPAGAPGLRFWTGLSSETNGEGRGGEVIYLDDFRLVDVTETYPQYLAAKAAADAAKATADQAAADAATAVELAGDAVREVGDTVREYVVQYAVGSSETAAPASGWSTSTPARTPGSFVWMRTVVTYADGDTSTTAPALLTGNAGSPGAPGQTGAPGAPGDDGAPGAPGVGLSSTAVTYALSTSGTTAPSTGWTAAVPTLIKGRYLWTRSVWTYTDGTSETGYSVAYVPQDGADGDDGLPGAPGVGITGTTITYAASSSGTTAPSSGWAAQPPAATAGQYVWTRTVWTYSNGTTETGYAVGKIGNTGTPGTPGAPGNDGAPGKDGLGIKSTVIAYALSTSATTAPTTGYTATVPTLVKGRYLWTRTLWTYTDNTTETGYSVAYVPQDGAKGDDGLPGAPGVGIASTAVTYAASSSGTVAPSSGWAAQPPAAAPGSFMWTRTVWTYTNGTTETGYSVGKIGETGSPGAPGGKGDTGVSVSSITPFFRAVARTAGAPAQPSGMTPSGWSTTEPAWSASTRLYRAERVVYSSGTVVWTPVTVVATYEGIVDVALSANGKNAITVSADAPTSGTPGVAAGDTWWRIDPDGVIFGQWRWTPLPVGWVPVTVRSEVIASLDVGKLVVTGSSRFTEAVVDNLWTDRLVGKIAAFQELTIASGNLLVNGDFSRGLEFWRSNAPWAVEDVAGVPGVTKALTSSGGTVSNAHSGPPFRLTGGEDYYFECMIWADKPDSRFFFEVRDQTGALAAVAPTVILEGGEGSSGNYMLSSYLVPTTPTRYRMRFTARPGSVEGRVASIYFNHPNGTERAAKVSITNIRIEPVKGVVRIADGTVGADKIVADEVAAAVSHLVEARVEKLTVTAGATINEAVILKLAAEMITAGVLRTAATGQRVQIDSSGLVLYSGETDDAGTELELARLGPSGENLLTIGSSTVSGEGVRAPAGAFDSLSVGGDDLSELLWQFARGRVSENVVIVNSDYSNLSRARISTNNMTYPGRTYFVNVPPFYMQGSAKCAVEYKLVYSWDSLTTTWDGANVIATGRFQLPDGNPHIVTGLAGDVRRVPDVGVPGELYVTLMVRSTDSTTVRTVARADYPLRVTVDDVGPYLERTGSYWTVGGTTAETTPPPPAAPTITRYGPTEWAHGGYGGDTKDGRVYQGTLSPYGNRYGGWAFPAAMRSALASSQIESVYVYLKNSHWYNGSGGTARIVPNDGSYKGVVFGSTNIESPGWPRYHGRWVRLPSSWHSFIANGTYKGVSVYATSTSKVYYGQFEGSATRFRATYRK